MCSNTKQQHTHNTDSLFIVIVWPCLEVARPGAKGPTKATSNLLASLAGPRLSNVVFIVVFERENATLENSLDPFNIYCNVSLSLWNNKFLLKSKRKKPGIPRINIICKGGAEIICYPAGIIEQLPSIRVPYSRHHHRALAPKLCIKKHIPMLTPTCFFHMFPILSKHT